MAHAAEAKSAIAIGFDLVSTGKKPDVLAFALIEAGLRRFASASQRATRPRKPHAGARSRRLLRGRRLALLLGDELGVGLAVHAEIDERGRGDEDRRVGRDEHAAQHHLGEILDRLATEDDERQKRQGRCRRGHRGARQASSSPRDRAVRRSACADSGAAARGCDRRPRPSRSANSRRSSRIAAIEVMLNSVRVIRKKPMVSTMSCIVPMMAPMANCSSKRNQR